MAIAHNLGFPRIGKNRELKKALEGYWKGEISNQELQLAAKTIRKENFQTQVNLDYIPINDFSFYDQMLDTSVLLGNIPSHYLQTGQNELDTYFTMARGRSQLGTTKCCAQEMTKWFDTNYHYIVPELTKKTKFQPNTSKITQEIQEHSKHKNKIKPVLIGPLTYLKLSKIKDETLDSQFIKPLIEAYQEILMEIKSQGIEWVQIDEPILAMDLSNEWKNHFIQVYKALSINTPNILLASYFGPLKDNLATLLSLPVDGIHVDITQSQDELPYLTEKMKDTQVLSLGVVNGRNIWKNNLNQTLDFLEPIHDQLQDRLWIAPSCSLLHVPVTLKSENHIPIEIINWLAFAEEKITEVMTLTLALNHGRAHQQSELKQNLHSTQSRQNSTIVHNINVQKKLTQLSEKTIQRDSSYLYRSQIQNEKFNLPLYPTTTIGSFPQTQEVRKARAQYKKGTINLEEYTQSMYAHIQKSIQIQEELGLDVLVHGEAERNDMVEYFGEQLQGFTFSQFGWVQSYGSRCVKPPIIYGDITRPQAMTVKWTQYAQSLTNKPVKGMLTGPVTILNWSFARDDIPLSQTCQQIALAIQEEVLDLEKSGVSIIQIDEAALREGLPLRQSDWDEYLRWSIDCFKLSANAVRDTTQIHTHMCYSEFNDIIEAIAEMDADVITIETSRSQMELLDVFDEFQYPNEIGPGVYDIHSPNQPNIEEIHNLLKIASQKIPADRIWVNPDCGLKTRQWGEVIPALKTMVDAAHKLRIESQELAIK